MQRQSQYKGYTVTVEVRRIPVSNGAVRWRSFCTVEHPKFSQALSISPDPLYEVEEQALERSIQEIKTLIDTDVISI